MTDYTPETGDKICAGLASGKSLIAVCEVEQIPYRHVFKWLNDPANQEFRDNYARARDAQIDFIAEDIITISDSGIAPDDKRVRIDARKWYAGRMKPKKYGDSTQLRHADADGNKISFQGILNDIDGGTASLPADKGEAE